MAAVEEVAALREHGRLVPPVDGDVLVTPLPARTRMTARGPDLHVFAGETWYRRALDDLP
ncbi:hypothetical protein [Dactylosporangium salmoneum]|uniref:Uncharacterized protein n=1 Tax=Dactylosporangium salmoneum TaxID=53361 RepID=A0ABP5T1M8_9ACTN